MPDVWGAQEERSGLPCSLAGTGSEGARAVRHVTDTRTCSGHSAATIAANASATLTVSPAISIGSTLPSMAAGGNAERGYAEISCRSWGLLAMEIFRGFAASATGIDNMSTPSV